MKKIQMIDQLFLHKLQFLYDVEMTIEKSLPKMIKKSTSESLKTGLSTHLAETIVQRERLEQIFKMLDENPKKVKSEAIRSIIIDGQNVLSLIDNMVLADIAITENARQIEHYEMSLYLCAMADAERLGYEEIEILLEESLQEELDTDETLAELSEIILETPLEVSTE